MEGYEENKKVITAKSNTVASNKAREECCSIFDIITPHLRSFELATALLNNTLENCIQALRFGIMRDMWEITLVLAK